MTNDLYKSFSLETEDNAAPVARIVPSEQEVVVGAIVKLDGRSSTDPEDAPLMYLWTFSQVPIGSQVEAFGFSLIEDDGSVVGFAPDITGIYRVQLVVSDGSLSSDPDESLVDVRIILVPNHQGYIPDASFIWNYLSDFWTQVPDRKKYETFWSATIQTTAAEMLKLYQYQYNQSIRDIQELIQKRWLSFSPALAVNRDTTSFVLADDTAGLNASTFIFDSVSGIPAFDQGTYSTGISIPATDGNFVRTPYNYPTAIGRLLVMGDRSYTLLRTNATFQAIDYGTDGATSGSVTFTGSNFVASMVGATLRILSATSTLVGDYIIASYTSSTQISITAIHPGTTWPGSSGLTYSVIPATANATAFYADRAQVPTGLEHQPWRFSATMISSDTDYEAQGVSPGDVIQVEITRTDLNVLSTFFVQVVSVDRNRVGFVLNLEDLVAGVAGGGFTEDIQVTLASDLIVPGLSADVNGNLTYSSDALAIYRLVTSAAFKRQFFDTELGPTDPITVGPFSIIARPVQIIRNRKVSVDPVVVSIPILQEYIKQPDVIEDTNGDIAFVFDGVKTVSPRKPYLLSENLDFIIDDEGMINGTCQITQALDEITIPRGDLIDRSVQEGDTIEVQIGATSEVFAIRKVLSADTLRVYPLPTISSLQALYTITRRLAGKFIRFITNAFTKKSPAPTRLWSEVSYLDNGEAIEGNFGILVGVRREDLAKVGSGIPYKSAVAGLMYALTNGPTISNLSLSAQILLGLPFAQNAGVITEIDPAFRKRADGSPLFGRILIQGLDNQGNPTGVTNIYLYPEGSQIFDPITSTWLPAVPDFSGIALNPDTGVEYKVGDIVTQFAPLSKGVQIQEYLSTPDWLDRLTAQGDVAAALQKYHAFQVLVNSDLVSSVDVDLTAQFMAKVKAHYVKLTSALLRFLEDVVDIQDDLTFGRTIDFYDASSLGLTTAVQFEDDDANESFITLDGIMYTRFLIGSDLVTTKDSTTVSSASGGFEDARIPHIESWDPPLLAPGDILSILKGSNAGRYPIDSVASDTSLVLSLPATNFETDTGQSFIVYRPLQNPIWEGTVGVTNGSATVSMPSGIGPRGVSVGDYLVFANLSAITFTSKRYKILTVNISSVSPTLVLDSNVSETTGEYDGWVVREQLIAQGPVAAYGITPRFFVNTTATGSAFTFTDSGSNINSWLNIALIRPGTEIVMNGITYTVLTTRGALHQPSVTPAILTTETNKQVTVRLRPERAVQILSVDPLDRFPSDYLQLEIQASLSVGDLAQTVATSANVTLSVETPGGLQVIPGDYLTLLSGGDSTRDIGFGAGVFPIFQITGGTTIVLFDALTATGSFHYGIRRRRPNEG